MSNKKLEIGEEVYLKIPFCYMIGDAGPITGNILNNEEDCKNEVRAELDSGGN